MVRNRILVLLLDGLQDVVLQRCARAEQRDHQFVLRFQVMQDGAVLFLHALAHKLAVVRG